ncbi:hypothetical protein [Sphingomicrobium lutaoense]|uniref:Uncharacterized protein n=1 Tax=Sphingomicrobium lutaoense TaxID=515949 RepID=A0A839Z3X4_9SPHN|nr:hypothetical protein [Sphingomicrobium lutaoense]MBB3764523.1 hypothetical protein [Sphingomicrobium lutaoense]
MNERSTAMSVIGALFLIFGAWAIFGILMTSDSEAFAEVVASSSLGREGVLATNILGGLITMASGYGVLKGMNWSRYLWTGWSILALIIGLLTAPFSNLALVNLAIIALFAYYLFRPQANAWFGGTADG